MITEDQLEQLAIQWFHDTGGVNIEHRTLNVEVKSAGHVVDGIRRAVLPHDGCGQADGGPQPDAGARVN
jgi:hypothetical protein